MGGVAVVVILLFNMALLLSLLLSWNYCCYYLCKCFCWWCCCNAYHMPSQSCTSCCYPESTVVQDCMTFHRLTIMLNYNTHFVCCTITIFLIIRRYYFCNNTKNSIACYIQIHKGCTKNNTIDCICEKLNRSCYSFFVNLYHQPIRIQRPFSLFVYQGRVHSEQEWTTSIIDMSFLMA